MSENEQTDTDPQHENGKSPGSPAAGVMCIPVLETGLCLKAIGVTYSPTYSCVKDGRALLTLDLYFLKVWLWLPWRHIGKPPLKRWGFWYDSRNGYYALHWGSQTKEGYI